MKACSWHRFAAGVFFAALTALTARAYVLMAPPYWPDGTVTLQIELGTQPIYSDESTPNSNALVALQLWNPFMARLQLVGSFADRPGNEHDNLINDVFFDDSVYGYAFDPDVLAVTIVSSDTQQRTEADVIVNIHQPWDAYPGPLKGNAVDIQRVLVHEFGNVLGLGHPDQAGQNVISIMNAYVSDVYEPTLDDQDGVAALYGRGSGHPGVSVQLDPTTPEDGVAILGQPAQFYVVIVSGSSPMRFQWRHDGQDIPGATGKVLDIKAVTDSDAGKYSVVVTNEAGSVISREATLTVNPAVLPQFYGFYGTDELFQVYLGQALLIQPNIGDDGPFTYQWRKNGIAIPGATYPFFPIYGAKTDGGVYTVIATNVAGSTISPDYTVMILPVPPPSIARVIASSGSSGDALDLSVPNLDVGSFTFQWYRDGVPIESQFWSEHDIPRTTAAADYFALVTNAGGSAPTRATHYTPEPPARTVGDSDWVEAGRGGDVIYFLFATPTPRIERYNLVTANWLSPITLSGTPHAIVVDVSWLYVAIDNSIFRFGLDGTGETHVADFVIPAGRLVLSNGYLYSFCPLGKAGDDSFPTVPFLTSVRTSDLAVIDRKEISIGIDDPSSISITPDGAYLFGRSHGSSGFFSRLELGADGHFGDLGINFDSRYYPDATETFVSRDGRDLLDNSGTVYSTTELTYAASTGEAFEDAALLEDGSYVMLARGMLTAYDSHFNATGREAVDPDATRLFVSGNTAVCFAQPSASGAGITVKLTPLSFGPAATLAPKVDPVEAIYTPAPAVLGTDEIVYLLSRTYRNVFRWSAAEGRYLEPIPLHGVANQLAYSELLHKLFVCYADNRIFTIDANGVEAPFVTLARQPDDIFVAGNFVFALEPNKLTSFALDGTLAAQIAISQYTDSYAWDPIHQRIFFFDSAAGSQGGISSREVRADGTFGPAAWPDDLVGLDFWEAPVLRISPDGTSLASGQGRFIAADTLTANFSLPFPVNDIAWLGQRVYTARETVPGTVVERWTGDQHSLDASQLVTGRFVRLFALPDNRLLLIVLRDGAPAFVALDSDLAKVEPVAPAISAQPASVSVTSGGAAQLSVSASASDVIYAWEKDGFLLEDSSSSSHAFVAVTPNDTGVYLATVTTAAGAASSSLAVLGLVSAAKTTGAASEVGSNIRHPNGNTYDQVLLQGTAASITADTGQTTRLSYIDENDDIVQVEFAGAGTLSLVLRDASGPAIPLIYNQPSVSYMKGRAAIVITGADETTNVSVFTVGRATAFDPTGAYNFLLPIAGPNTPDLNGSPLFQGISGTPYDGVADIAYIAILSRNGRFGGIRAANARFSATEGITGIYAPGVALSGPLFLGELKAHDGAFPKLIIGSSPDTRIAGGNLHQPNGRPIAVSGIVSLKFTNGLTSYGGDLYAQRNQAIFEQDGSDVTDLIVVNPTP